MSSIRFLESVIRELIQSELQEVWNNPKPQGGRHYFDNVGADIPEDKKDRIRKGGGIDTMRASINQAEADSIEEKMSFPEYQNVEAFVEFKLDDEDYTFNHQDIITLANVAFYNETGTVPSVPDQNRIKQIRADLESFGLQLRTRDNVKVVRGSQSNAHGAHPFAGQGGGGSGLSSIGYEVGGIGLGGGPGVIGGSKRNKDGSLGGRLHNPNDPTSLSYGGTRRKK